MQHDVCELRQRGMLGYRTKSFATRLLEGKITQGTRNVFMQTGFGYPGFDAERRMVGLTQLARIDAGEQNLFCVKSVTRQYAHAVKAGR